MDKNREQEKLHSQIIGEWMFGLTDTVIKTPSGQFLLMSHELLMYVVKMAAGDDEFQVRRTDHTLQVLNRLEMQAYLGAAGKAMSARHVVMAEKMKALADGGAPDPTTSWPRRNPILEKLHPRKE